MHTAEGGQGAPDDQWEGGHDKYQENVHNKTRKALEAARKPGEERVATSTVEIYSKFQQECYSMWIVLGDESRLKRSTIQHCQWNPLKGDQDSQGLADLVIEIGRWEKMENQVFLVRLERKATWAHGDLCAGLPGMKGEKG